MLSGADAHRTRCFLCHPHNVRCHFVCLCVCVCVRACVCACVMGAEAREGGKGVGVLERNILNFICEFKCESGRKTNEEENK